MMPTLKPGAMLFIDKVYYRNHTPKRGEVIVFRHGDSTYVKRVYRAPGEELTYIEAYRDWVKPVRETRVSDTHNAIGQNDRNIRVRDIVVPRDSVFVLGDNFNNSEDSRNLGPIPLSSILGRAWLPTDPTIAMRFEFAPPRRGPQMHTLIPAPAARPRG